MNFKEIQELIKIISESNLMEFKMKNKDLDIHIRTDKYQKNITQQVVSAPQVFQAAPSSVPVSPSAAPSDKSVPVASAPKSEEAKPANSNLLEIKSPIVGTFYRSPGPDKPAFTKVGDKVNQGDVVCIIEAMKLFNEIESEVTGTIVKVCVEDAAPVEYDQVLFLVEV
jgi:acetyl-CoA carboxylase biotin carboxyl carrier protein